MKDILPTDDRTKSSHSYWDLDGFPCNPKVRKSPRLSVTVGVESQGGESSRRKIMKIDTLCNPKDEEIHWPARNNSRIPPKGRREKEVVSGQSTPQHLVSLKSSPPMILPFQSERKTRFRSNLSRSLPPLQMVARISTSNDHPSSPQTPTDYPNLLKRCTNCETRSTPSWRRGTDGKLLCNACGLYEKINERPRRFRTGVDGTLRVRRMPSSIVAERLCENCSVKSTLLWRRIAGLYYCNACAIYYKTNGCHRLVTNPSDEFEPELINQPSMMSNTTTN